MLITHNQMPLKRFLFGRKRRFGVAYYHIEANKPPLKTFNAFLSPILFTWKALVPPSVKYFGSACILGLCLTKIHPNVLFTVGPPVVLSAWFSKRHLSSQTYKKELQTILASNAFDNPDTLIELQPYDESDADLVLNGIESEFDLFKTQIADIVTRRMRDYASIESNGKLLLVDSNGQFCLHLSKAYIETFVLLKADVVVDETSHLVNFMKLSMPLFSLRQDKIKKATVEIYLLQVPETVLEYKMVLKITPYQWVNAGTRPIVITSVPGGKMKSETIKKSEADSAV